MKIIYVNTTIYDFMTATVIEGLTNLGHTVLCSESSNYGLAAPHDILIREAPAAHLVILGSNLGVNFDLFARLQSDRKIHIDGGDHAHLALAPDLGIRAVFKRELNSSAKLEPGTPIFPLPFAAEDRYFPTEPPRKDLALSFLANMNTNPLRYSIHQRIAALRHEDPIVSGSTNECSYNGRNGHALATPRYRGILLRSRISINVPGAGYDCARYWEIPAAGAMLMTWEPDIAIPDGFTDGVDCVTFSSLGEFDEKARYYLGRADLAGVIARRGFERVSRHHTTRARAQYLLQTAERALGSRCISDLAPA